MKYKELPLSAEKIQRLETFGRMYRASGVMIEPVSFEDGRLTVRAEQKEITTDKSLTKDELARRARDMFAGEIPDTWRLTVSAVNRCHEDIDKVVWSKGTYKVAQGNVLLPF
jgi:hypothetical protein